MITNLFSTFDPSTRIKLSINWRRALIWILIIPPIYWLIPSRLNLIWLNLITTLHKEFKILIKRNEIKGRTILFIALFSIIIINNFIGLFPYIFTSTAHLIHTLSIRLPLWLTIIIFGWLKNTKHILAHLVPQGAPRALLPFLVIIETISNLIRPGTLAIRLTANIIAGHLLVTLLGNSGTSLSIYILNILIIVQILLLTLESAVAIIQSYVFSILSTLYSREVI